MISEISDNRLLNAPLFILNVDGDMEYLLGDFNHGLTHAPQLAAYQRIITSASNQYPLAAWLNYDVFLHSYSIGSLATVGCLVY